MAASSGHIKMQKMGEWWRGFETVGQRQLDYDRVKKKVPLFGFE